MELQTGGAGGYSPWKVRGFTGDVSMVTEVTMPVMLLVAGACRPLELQDRLGGAETHVGRLAVFEQLPQKGLRVGTTDRAQRLCGQQALAWILASGAFGGDRVAGVGAEDSHRPGGDQADLRVVGGQRTPQVAQDPAVLGRGQGEDGDHLVVGEPALRRGES